MAAPSASLLVTATVPVALLLGAGYAVRRRGMVDDGFRAGLLTLVLKVFFPALILAKVSVNPELKNNTVALWAPLAGFLSSAGGFALASLASRFVGAGSEDRRRAFAYTAGHYNYSYLAIPVCGTLYGPESIATLLLFNMGIELSFWTIGMLVLKGGGAKESIPRMLNPITLSVFAAIAINRTGLAPRVPDCGFVFLNLLGACGVPCGLLLLGMGLPALLQGFRAHHEPAIAIGGVLVRNLLIPACFVGAALGAAALPFFAMPPAVVRLLLLQAAMPSGTMTLIMCQHHQVAPRVSLRIFVASTLAGIVTLPFWLWVGGTLAAR